MRDRMQLSYDCDVCGKTHKLKATWTKADETNLKAHFNVDIMTDASEALIDVARRSFELLHPKGTFDEGRVTMERFYG